MEMVQEELSFISINGKSHMCFRLVPNSVTLDDLGRRNSPKRRQARSQLNTWDGSL